MTPRALMAVLALGGAACAPSVPPEALEAALVANQALDAGTPLLASTFESAGPATSISKKFRSYSIPVAGAEGVLPGRFVDVLASVVDPALGEAVTLTLLQRVQVLAVAPIDPSGAAGAGDRAEPPTRLVALLTLPEEAELLTLAARLGTLHLALRHPDDHRVSEDSGRATMETLRSGERTKVTQRKRFDTIQIIKGSGGGCCLAGASSLRLDPGRSAASGAKLRAGRAAEQALLAPLHSLAPQHVFARALEAPRLGQVLVRDEQGLLQPLPARALRVLTQIEGARARTIVDYVVENGTEVTLEGSFRWALPQGATPSYFGMFQGSPTFERAAFDRLGGHLLPLLDPQADALGDLQSLVPAAAVGTAVAQQSDAPWQGFRAARVVKAAAGTQTYEKIVRPRVDPALLEWSGANTFEARVYPLAPRALKRVVLVYEQTLPMVDGQVRYAFPMPDRPIDEVRYRLAVDATKSAPSTLRAGAGAVALETGATTAGRFWVREVDLSGGKVAGELELTMRPADARAQFLASGPIPGLPGGYVFGRVLPEVSAAESTAPTGDAVFVLDTSLSEAGARSALSAQMLEAVLAGDESIERFNVLRFDVRASWLEPSGWIANSAEGRARALALLSETVREGATSLESALDVLEHTSWLSAPATAFLLSDGQLTWGGTDPDALVKAAPKARALRWVAYEFGGAASNRALLEALASTSGGRIVTCLTAGEVPALARAHRARPLRLTSVTVEGGTVSDLVIRGAPAVLFAGQSLELAGRVLAAAPGTAELVVRGTFEGQPVEQRFPLALAGDDLLAPRAWAELEVEKLLELRSPKVERLVLALSQRFGLANRLASFLILETDAGYEHFQLRGEAVDLAALETQARAELADPRAREPGLSLDGVPAAGLALIEKLPTGRALAPALDSKREAGGPTRQRAERAFALERARNPDELMPFYGLSRARFAAGDALGALRAISSMVELRPGDCDALRLTAYVLLEQGEWRAAAALLSEVRRRRPFEVQAFLEEALALVQAGDLAGATRDYEIALARTWARHPEVLEAGRLQYAQLLSRVADDPAFELATRALAHERRLAVRRAPVMALQITLDWNVDDVDVDLLVTDPSGRQVGPDRGETRGGGRVLWNARTGYGPELFRQSAATPGPWLVQARYRWNASEQWAIAPVVLAVLDQAPDDFSRFKRTFATVALPFESSTQTVVRTKL